MHPLALWGVLCLAVAGGFLASALRIWVLRRRFLARSRPAAGRVVEVRVRGVGRNAENVPVLELRTDDGAVRRVESWMGSSFQGFTVGQEVAARYDPASGRAEVDSFAVLWGLALLRAGFALLFLLMGLAGLLLAWRGV